MSGVARKAGIASAVLGGLATTTAAGLWWQLWRRPRPLTEGSVRVAGLDGPVEIRRDRWGVPHVSATTKHDLWFGQGFCQGQDRLWQLDLYRRVAMGRLAEIAGPTGLASDRFMRTLGLRRAGVREAAAIDSELRADLDAMAAGINAAAEAAPAPPLELQLLRLEFEPWTAADSLAMQKLLSFGLSTNWERELLRADLARELGPDLAAKLDPSYPPANAVVLTPGIPAGAGIELAERVDSIRRFLGMTVEATGSNNWAVAPSRSATDGALIAGDPHLSPSMPGITYQMGLRLGERWCRGAALPGTLGVAFGHNNDVAWTLTNAMADVMDLFVERVDGDRYQFEDEWRELESFEEEITIRGQPPETIVARETHHGPIVNEALRADESEPLALAWMSRSEPAISKANTVVIDVRSGAELVELMEEHATPVSSLVWADSGGSIGYKTVGRIPMRTGGSPDLPRCGWSGEDEWEGWIPYGEQPEVTDPESGYVVTANNRIEPEGFEHHIGSDYFDGFRATRIEQMIEAEPEHDLSTFARMQVDMRSLPGLETAHRLARLRPRDQAETSAIERLRSWDGQMAPDSIAATIYQAFTLRFAREIARAVIGDRDLTERWLDRADNGFMAHVSSPWRWQAHMLALWDEGDEELIGRAWEDLALDSLRAALRDLGKRFGTDPAGWRWGKVHELHFPHALGPANPALGWLLDRSIQVGGAQETVCQVGWDPNDPFEAIWAPCWRMVADLSQPEGSRWQQFTGNSGHPGSPHYDDLQPRWRDGLMQASAGEPPWRTLRLEPDA
jgi:penicillin G amidase